MRFALLRSVIEEGGKRDVARYHAACADVPENMELFGQLNFMAYAHEEIWYRPPGQGSRAGGRTTCSRHAARRVAPLRPLDAHHPAGDRADRGLRGAQDWEPVGHEGVVPRSSLNPILHFSAVNAWLLPEGQRVAGFAQHGACRDGPHYLRFLVRDGADGARVPGRRAAGGRRARRSLQGSSLRCEHTSRPGRQAAEAAGFEAVGQVSMLVREVLASVRAAGDGPSGLVRW